MTSIFRNIGWLLGSRGINAALSLIYLALATRSLGVEGFGQFSVIIVLAQAIAGIASFNTWQAVVHWGHAEGNTAPVTGFALALDLVSICAGLALAALVSLTAPAWLPLSSELGPAAFALCTAALIGMRSTPTGLLRLHDRYDLATLAEATLPATRAAGAIIAALFVQDIVGFVAAWAAAEIVCAATYWLLARQYVQLHFADISLRRLPRALPGVWSFVFATSLSRTAAVASKQVLLLGIGVLGGAVLAGGYRVASQLGQALVQLGEAVSRAVYPEFVRRMGDSAEIAGRMVAIAAATGLVTAVIAALCGKWAIALIAGPAFVFAYPALAILAFAGALELAGASWESLLVARKRAGSALVARIVPLALALASMPAAIAQWGLAGVAACILVASMLTLCGLFGLARRHSSEPGQGQEMNL